MNQLKKICLPDYEIIKLNRRLETLDLHRYILRGAG